jgi:hypothetical protein
MLMSCTHIDGLSCNHSWNKFSTLEYQTQFIECEGSSMELYYDTYGCTGTLRWQTYYFWRIKIDEGEKRSGGKTGASVWLLISLPFRTAIHIIRLPNKLLDSRLTSEWSVNSNIIVTCMAVTPSLDHNSTERLVGRQWGLNSNSSTISIDCCKHLTGDVEL